MSTFESDDLERLRAALASLAEDEHWPEPNVERIYAAVHGGLGVDERRAVIDELVRNPRAAQAWQLARELAPEGSTDRIAVPNARRSWVAPRAWTWMAAAASVLLVVALGTQVRFTTPETPAYRSAESRRIESRLRADALSRAEPVLRWTPVEGARYRVRVLTADLDLIEEAEDLAASEYRVSAGAMQRIGAGQRILWQVEARVPGTTPITSPTFSVQVQ